LQRSSRSWSIECRISAAFFTFAKRFAATAASYVIQACPRLFSLDRKKNDKTPTARWGRPETRRRGGRTTNQAVEKFRLPFRPSDNTPQFKREWSLWPEFGWILGNLCDLSKAYFAMTFLSSSPPTPASQSGLCERCGDPGGVGDFPCSSRKRERCLYRKLDSAMGYVRVTEFRGSKRRPHPLQEVKKRRSLCRTDDPTIRIRRGRLDRPNLEMRRQAAAKHSRLQRQGTDSKMIFRSRG
jgi:hypothetical protein